jgi:hypothetical protein
MDADSIGCDTHEAKSLIPRRRRQAMRNGLPIREESTMTQVDRVMDPASVADDLHAGSLRRAATTL